MAFLKVMEAFQRQLNTAALLMSFALSLMGLTHCFPNLGSYSKCVFCQSTENSEMAWILQKTSACANGQTHLYKNQSPRGLTLGNSIWCLQYTQKVCQGT